MSPVRLHPLTHVVICLLFSSIVFAFSQLNQLGLICLLCFCYSLWRSEAGVWQFLASLIRSLPFVISLAILQLLFRREGSVIWRLFFLSFTDSGLYWSAVISLRLVTVVLCAKALAVNSFQDFQAAFAKLHIPEEFAFMLSYGVQLVPGFLAQIKGYIRCLQIRGIEPAKLPWTKRLQVYKLLAVSALAGIISGSTRSAIALELRGFRSQGKRSYLHNRSFNLGDWGAIMLVCLGIIAVGKCL